MTSVENQFKAQERRKFALQSALDLHGRAGKTDKILEAAKEFDSFLKGEESGE